MRFAYDLHIHSALSPCADDDMTPNNIVNMALLNELDIISVTDHNTIKNVLAVSEVAKEAGLLFVPGIEVETSEEVHVVCLFENFNSLNDFYKTFESMFPFIENKPDIFGRQLIMNRCDEIISEENRLLLTASEMDFYGLAKTVKEHGGAFIPAHVDRNSYSVISNLGMIPDDLNIKYIEFSRFYDNSIISNVQKYNALYSSDAHRLGEITQAKRFLELPDKSTKSLISLLNGTSISKDS